MTGPGWGKTVLLDFVFERYANRTGENCPQHPKPRDSRTAKIRAPGENCPQHDTAPRDRGDPPPTTESAPGSTT
eukprot:CAMPEP_0180137474 /NCGR_PEP_ID=MMETSP0986-20121125/12235_1 /TAXON_ID=697907 /ORGANISM="non described non described, Strain CCMP2293" /LENGTH=73 /DNA_ID=CAMNT_0022078945 /DNA_START=43 /DNA_END=261 /DNA_ORIENTATION=+